MTRQRAGNTETRYGDTKIDWSTTTDATFLGWLDSTPQAVRSRAITELTTRAGELSTGTLYAPATLDIRNTDRVLVGGDLWQIDSIPAKFYRADGTVSHLQMIVSRFQG
jgi:hypothetical protein